MTRSIVLHACAVLSLLVLGTACRQDSSAAVGAQPPAAADDAGVGPLCGEEAPCPAPEQCIEYYGFAGPKGPKFFACEIPCGKDDEPCPEGTQCITIADGPGQVCRPAEEPINPPAVAEDPSTPKTTQEEQTLPPAGPQ